MKTKLYLVCILASFSFSAVSQDPNFFNASQSLVYLNPSFAGSNGGVRDQFSYYNQRPALYGSSFITFLNTFDAYIKPLHGGIAVSVLTDQSSYGLLKNSGLSIAYAQHLSFMDNNLKIIPSVQAGYNLKNLDTGHGLTYGDVVDLRMNTVWIGTKAMPLNNLSYFDVGAGILVNYRKNFYAGLAVSHLNQPDAGMLGVQRLPAKLALHASYNLTTADNIPFNISAKYMSQGSSGLGQLSGNAVFFKHLVVGMGIAVTALNHNYILLNVGCRTDFMAIGFFFDRGLRLNSNADAASYGINLALFRSKPERSEPIAFEAW